MKGHWRHGVNDPRNDLDEIRRWFWDRNNTTDAVGDAEVIYDHGSNLVQKALGAALIGDLRGDSATLRFIFAIIERRQENKRIRDDVMPGPYFIEALQILLLAAKPTQREDLMNAIFEATGMPQGIAPIVR